MKARTRARSVCLLCSAIIATFGHISHAQAHARSYIRGIEGHDAASIASDNTQLRHLSQFSAEEADFVFPRAAGVVNVQQTIEVSANEVFDGRMQRYLLPNATGFTPLIRVREGGTVQNLIVGMRGGVGIACFGSCTLKDVWFRDVGDGAAIRIVKTSVPPMILTMTGGGIRGATDVGIQINAPAQGSLKDVVFDNTRTGIWVCDKCKPSPGSVSMTIESAKIRYTDISRRFVGTEGEGDNSFTISGLSFLNESGRRVPLCEGPPSLCTLE